ncbi:MAG TPA: hypothetical protein VLK65_08670 [Vicinamibacteria bacterium]|nr:hypothetical protein [Vicinamibacteria bacterium]
MTPYVFLALGLTPARSEPESVSQLLKRLRCAPQVEELLGEWTASSEVLRAPPGIDGRGRYRISTARLGVWITVEIPSSPPEPVRLFRTEASSGTSVELDGGCNPTFAELPGISAPEVENGFTDSDLERLLAVNDRLVVFLWSPHLPLSVEGYGEIAAAVSELGIPLAAVVDPSAVPELVDEVSERNGIPLEARRVLASVELLFRDLAVHAPTVLFFWRGKAEAPLPGYRDRRAYVEFFERVMARPN